MKFRMIYSLRHIYDEIVELSDEELNGFFRYLVEVEDYTWSVIDHYRKQETIWLLIEQHFEYFEEKLEGRLTYTDNLEAIEITEEE